MPQALPKGPNSNDCGVHIGSLVTALGCCFWVCVLVISVEGAFVVFWYDLDALSGVGVDKPCA